MTGQNQKPEENLMPHGIVLQQRSRLSVTGVKSIVYYDDTGAQMETTQGRLTISGRELQVSELSTQSGQLEISGKIDGLEYTQAGEKNGFLSRFFR